jgi:hypothetical protein
MPHHGDLRAHDRPYRFRHLSSALQLDGAHAALLDQAAGIPDGLGQVDLIAQKRHITNDHRVLNPSRHTPAVIQHLVHGDREGGIPALHRHAEGIPDQNRVDAPSSRIFAME